MKRCCIIYNEPGEGALADELDVLDQVAHIEKHLDGTWIYQFTEKESLTGFMEEIADPCCRKT